MDGGKSVSTSSRFFFQMGKPQKKNRGEIRMKINDKDDIVLIPAGPFLYGSRDECKLSPKERRNLEFLRYTSALSYGKYGKSKEIPSRLKFGF